MFKSMFLSAVLAALMALSISKGALAQDAESDDSLLRFSASTTGLFTEANQLRKILFEESQGFPNGRKAFGLAAEPETDWVSEMMLVDLGDQTQCVRLSEMLQFLLEQQRIAPARGSGWSMYDARSGYSRWTAQGLETSLETLPISAIEENCGQKNRVAVVRFERKIKVKAKKSIRDETQANSASSFHKIFEGMAVGEGPAKPGFVGFDEAESRVYIDMLDVPVPEIIKGQVKAPSLPPVGVVIVVKLKSK